MVASHRTSKSHLYTLPEAPAFLSETTAMEKAKETMAAEEYDMKVWFPREDGRSKAPDGQDDVFLSRNSINPKDCTIWFYKGSPSNTQDYQERIVHVELRGNTILCEIIKPM